MKNFSKRQIIFTEDGSHSIYLPDLDEHYHSIHGALQESKHVFIEMGWKKIAEIKNEINILEMGFGTGLNAFLVLKECLCDGNKKVKYTSLERFPLAKEEVLQLNYAQEEAEKEMFLKLHEVEWNAEVEIAKNFSLGKEKTALENIILSEKKYDLVFFDAFSPESQPELWTEEIFRKLFLAMNSNSILVTYCAKGQVRRNMIAAGFSVERLQGPPGKREMIRAGK